MAAFGAVGAVGLVIDVGLFNVFFHEGQIVAKTISTIVATTVTYVGNRYFSFSHRARSGIGRETSLFFGINLVVLGFSEADHRIKFVYPLHLKHHVFAMNAGRTSPRSVSAPCSGSGPTSGSCSCTRTRCTNTSTSVELDAELSGVSPVKRISRRRRGPARTPRRPGRRRAGDA